MAMVATGPMPGSTPISVPSRQPMKAYSRLMGVKATPKPSTRLLMRSMVCVLSAGQEAGPDRELQLEQQDEGQVTHDGQDGREDDDLLVLVLLAGHAGNEGERVDADHQAHGRNADL